MEEKIVIFPCNGDCAAGRITWIAAQELVLEGKAKWCSSPTLITEDFVDKHLQRFIIVDGCEKKCLFNAYLEKGLAGKHHLALNDVGIDPILMKDITNEDITLAKDAVIAECAEIDNMPPPLFSGCCCK